MKKRRFIQAMLFITYCVPFAFLSVNGDAASGTMLFYGIMVAALSLLCWVALKTSNVTVLYIGNIFSFVSSLFAAKLSGLEPMGSYFKPFTSHAMVVMISAVSIILQTIIILAYAANKKVTSNSAL